MISKNARKTPKSEILYESDNAIGKGSLFMRNTTTRKDITLDKNAPSIVVQIPAYYEGYKDITRKGAKIRCITDVTPENVLSCKKLSTLVTELRHLDGLKGGIAVNESEYMATTVLQKTKRLRKCSIAMLVK